MSGSALTFGSSRRADIDYLRVGALALLIIYHVLCVYDSWDWWRVKSTHAGPWADYIITALTPWRMTLVFFVGGVAARFMLEANKPLGFVKDRAAKLLTAFAFAVIVIIPLQRYIRLDNQGGATPPYLDYLINTAPHVVNFEGVWVPDFAHAWFLPYLFIYSLALAASWRFAPKRFAAWQARAERAPIWLIAAIAMFGLGLHQAVLMPLQPETSLVLNDLTAHFRFVPVFLFGALIGKSSVFFNKLIDARHWLWSMAGMLLVLSLLSQVHIMTADPHGEDRATDYHFTHGLYGGVALLSVIAFGARFLRQARPGLAYATDAILPIYLMHQTVLVVAADALVPLRLPLALELPMLTLVTVLLPLAIYHLFVRGFTPLRVLFGLRLKARAPAVDASPSGPDPQVSAR